MAATNECNVAASDDLRGAVRPNPRARGALASVKQGKAPTTARQASGPSLGTTHGITPPEAANVPPGHRRLPPPRPGLDEARIGRFRADCTNLGPNLHQYHEKMAVLLTDILHTVCIMDAD